MEGPGQGILGFELCKMYQLDKEEEQQRLKKRLEMYCFAGLQQVHKFVREAGRGGEGKELVGQT